MIRKKWKWIAVWAIFLSLPLLALSSVSGAGEEETQRTVEEVHQPVATVSYGQITATAAALAAQPAVNEARWYEFWSHHPPPQKKIPKVSTSFHLTSHGVQTGNGHCGGDLPPCWVLDKESGYNDGDPNTYDIHAYNATGCDGYGCSGKWQCSPGSCNGTGTEEEQDAEARELWDGGRGCSHWNACG